MIYGNGWLVKEQTKINMTLIVKKLVICTTHVGVVYWNNVTSLFNIPRMEMIQNKSS